MQNLPLRYGETSLDYSFDERHCSIIDTPPTSGSPLTDAEIGASFDYPIGSPPLEEILSPGDSVLVVVSDATRATASAQVVHLLVRRLLQNGISPADIRIIFATGIHRSVTVEEQRKLVTPFVAQRITTLVHDAYDLSVMIDLGTTEIGTPVQLNPTLKQQSHVILTGGINFHYFAGFTGGRKSVCPGLASVRTIEATHKLALDFETAGRRRGVGVARLEGNAVNEECERIASLIAPSFCVNVIVNETGQAVQIFSGEWRIAHREGCQQYLQSNSVQIGSCRNLVIASCGGAPHDLNFIQAHKALEMSALACNEGGEIILIAECRDGVGRPDFLKWFDVTSSAELEARLSNEYQVNGQTAWSLMTKTERFRIYLVSQLPAEQVKRMNMIPAPTLAAALAQVDPNEDAYIIPRGAAVLPVVTSSA
ncbi:MAG: nickel-dependent lactate racemase [Pyrinomonadaceae bacterium]